MGSKTMKLINIFFEASPVLQEVETIPKFSFPFIGKKKKRTKEKVEEGTKKRKKATTKETIHTHTHTHTQTVYI